MDMTSAVPEDMSPTVALHQKRNSAGVLPDEAYLVFQDIIQPASFLLAVLGVITNVINIRVFVEQGVKNNNTNIGLLALSIFDLFSCCLMVAPISCNIFTYVHDLPKHTICQTYTHYTIFLAYAFTYCSNWTTVYISTERTLCVVIPLKVKLFLRPKLTVFVIVSIFIFFIIIKMIYSTSTSIVWIRYPSLNLTLPYLKETAFTNRYLAIYSTMANTVLNSLAIFIVAINTMIMIYKLNQFKAWRQSTTTRQTITSKTTTGQNASDTTSDGPKQPQASMSSKDADLVKSVTAVTGVLLVCVSMSHIPATTILVLPGVSFTGINRNLMFLAYTIRSVFSQANASANFFFYLKVSSRYKESFNNVFKCSSSGSEKSTS